MGLTLVQRTPPAVPDAAEREQALDVTSSWICEAPAGSGKTGLLIQRFLKLLALVDDPAEVLALTFTQKATAEMRSRVLAAVRDAEAGSPVADAEFDRLTRRLAEAVLARDRERDWQLLRRSHRLNIRTIDSLCSTIARAVPLLSGNGGVSQPVRDPAPYYRRAAHAVMLEMGGRNEALNDAVKTVLLHRDGDLPFCEGILAEMLGTREQWGRLVPLAGSELDDATLDREVLPRLNETLQRVICAALTRIHREFSPHALARLASIMQELAHAKGYGDMPSAFAACAHLTGGPGTDAEHIDHWLLLSDLLLTKGGTWRTRFGSRDIGAQAHAAIVGELKQLVEEIGTHALAALLNELRELPPPVYPEDQWRVAKALFRLLQRALVELRLLFAEEEVCDFSEVALAARAALESDANGLQAAFGTSLRHLLVDEMQDTSSSQYELLRLLTAGWDGSSQTLFLVGDPKQSIYLFRQARVDLFQKCMRDGRLGEVDLGVLKLSANFRSGEKIVTQFNGAFQRVFVQEEPEPGDVTYGEAHAVRPEQADEGIEWHVLPVPHTPDTTAARRQRERALRREAVSVAECVRAWRTAHPGSRVAVLTRVRTHVVGIVRALGELAVPYRAVEMDPLSERREVLDALAITRALLHPADRTAWLALLRAPWCGVELLHLFTLAAGDRFRQRHESLRVHLRERSAGLPDEARARVLRTLDVMDAAVRQSATQPLAEVVERTWRSLGGAASTGTAGQENVRQFLREIDAMEAGNEPIDLHTLQRRMDRLFAAADSAADAVDVMTIHKAKGLEWDMVLVPGMHRVSAVTGWPLLDWLELPGAGPDAGPAVLLAPVPSKGGDPGKLNQYIRASRKRLETAELKRLFYVAATRARTSLHLSAWPETSSKGERVKKKQTLLAIAAPAEPTGLPRAEAVTEPSVDLMPLLPDGPALELERASSEPLALAAAAETQRLPLPAIQRLPAGYDPLAELRAGDALQTPTQDMPPPERFRRPEGSFGARAVGTTLHAFIDRLGRELGRRMEAGANAGSAAEALLAELPGWQPAVRNALRAGSLPPQVVQRAAETVLRGLTNLLIAPECRWALLPHHQAQSEAAWRFAGELATVRVRLDRSFFAGSAPGEPGHDTLWIVDFKTGDHASAGQDAFLQGEQERYRAQLETYAEVRQPALPPGTPVMLALCYPLMGRLIFWRYGANLRAAAASRDSPQLQLF